MTIDFTSHVSDSDINSIYLITIDSIQVKREKTKELSGAMHRGKVISGKDLKNVRESLRIELEDIFQATKISPTTLEAIEKDDIANLPPTIYLKSFLKSYAEILQLDTTKIVEGYLKNIETG